MPILAVSGMMIRLAPYFLISSATRFSMDNETIPKAVARLEAMASTATSRSVRARRYANARSIRCSCQRFLCMLPFQSPHRLDCQRLAQRHNASCHGNSHSADDGGWQKPDRRTHRGVEYGPADKHRQPVTKQVTDQSADA